MLPIIHLSWFYATPWQGSYPYDFEYGLDSLNNVNTVYDYSNLYMITLTEARDESNEFGDLHCIKSANIIMHIVLFVKIQADVPNYSL